ncbi:MAG TPA: hypothetical protein VFU43_01705 [Streptosporangiaceae bacterium]|nr:hypothetical protein [Streptosporangiaceae bacterium]
MDQELVWAGGVGEPPDGVAAQVQVAGDLFEAVALGDQDVDGGIPFAGADVFVVKNPATGQNTRTVT